MRQDSTQYDCSSMNGRLGKRRRDALGRYLRCSTKLRFSGNSGPHPLGAHRRVFLDSGSAAVRRPGITVKEARRRSSSRCELRRAERVLALDIVDLAVALLIGQYREPSLHRRTRRDSIVPALDRGVLGKVEGPALVEMDAVL